jgi:predicted phage baseplate assembly protein
MPLPEPLLDDLRFQKDLVDEARRRIIRYTPEWTDYNLSDPGITLIELFAWMTELLAYRMNRLPEKNYLRFLELLGVQLQPASSARTAVTFYLSTPFPIGPEADLQAVVPPHTEIATRRTDEEDEVIFTTDARLAIVAPKLTQLRRELDFNKNYQPRLGIETFYPFNPRPRAGDTFYLGFEAEQSLSGHTLQLRFVCEETQATGVRRSDPPLVWECSIGGGKWQEITPSARLGEKDTTGGLNNPEGQIIFYLPLTMAADQVYGRAAFWIRCRVEQRRREQGMYTETPRLLNVSAFTLGATTTATHAVFATDEELGVSTGEPGQTFRLQNAPVLALQPGEAVEVEEKRDGEWVFVPWQPVEDFSNSDRFDRHFTLDMVSGEVAFGPAIRQPDGGVRSYGRVPEAGRRVRFSRYRYGGGAVGNVPEGKLQVLKSAIPYIDRVTNLVRAEGGRDAENLEEAKMRARREVRAQQRAVTAEDFEMLARNASRAVARVKCRTPGSNAAPPGTIELLVVPAAFDSLRAGDLTPLCLDAQLLFELEKHLDRYRLMTTSVRLREPSYVGVRADVEIVVDDYASPDVVKARVAERLRQFLSPLAVGPEAAAEAEAIFGPGWEGWPFGRPLFVSEVFTLVQQVPGVKHVLDVHLSHRPVLPARETPPRSDDMTVAVVNEQDRGRAEAQAEAAPALVAVTERRLDIAADALLCSLSHEVRVAEL